MIEFLPTTIFDPLHTEEKPAGEGRWVGTDMGGKWSSSTNCVDWTMLFIASQFYLKCLNKLDMILAFMTHIRTDRGYLRGGACLNTFETSYLALPVYQIVCFKLYHYYPGWVGCGVWWVWVAGGRNNQT